MLTDAELVSFWICEHRPSQPGHLMFDNDPGAQRDESRYLRCHRRACEIYVYPVLRCASLGNPLQAEHRAVIIGSRQEYDVAIVPLDRDTERGHPKFCESLRVRAVDRHHACAQSHPLTRTGKCRCSGCPFNDRHAERDRKPIVTRSVPVRDGYRTQEVWSKIWGLRLGRGLASSGTEAEEHQQSSFELDHGRGVESS
jgi:hypothetical protein